MEAIDETVLASPTPDRNHACDLDHGCSWHCPGRERRHVAPPASFTPTESTPAFTIRALESGNLYPANADERGNPLTTQSLSKSQEGGLSFVAATTAHQDALLDATLLDEGVLVATGKDFVDLSWRKEPSVQEYLVYHGGKLLARTNDTSIRDSDITPGNSESYRLVPVRSSHTPSGVETDREEPQIIGIHARTPDASQDISSAAEKLAANTEFAASQTGSTIKVATFIPQSKIDAPAVGCDYGSSHQFHGDGRSFSPHSNANRTGLLAYTRWDSDGGGPRLTGYSASVGETIVYEKSTGEEVERKTASTDDIWVSELGSDEDKVDLRFSVQARNPFCGVSSIAGAFTMNAYKSGSWIIRSGSHRQMPNWEAYITWLGGEWNTVYKKQYYNEICLIELACPEAQMGGLAGETYDWQWSGRSFLTDDDGLSLCQAEGREGVHNGYWSGFDCQTNNAYLNLLVRGATFESTGEIYGDFATCSSRALDGIESGEWAAFQCRPTGSLYELWIVYTHESV